MHLKGERKQRLRTSCRGHVNRAAQKSASYCSCTGFTISFQQPTLQNNTKEKQQCFSCMVCISLETCNNVGTVFVSSEMLKCRLLKWLLDRPMNCCVVFASAFMISSLPCCFASAAACRAAWGEGGPYGQSTKWESGISGLWLGQILNFEGSSYLSSGFPQRKGSLQIIRIRILSCEGS